MVVQYALGRGSRSDYDEAKDFAARLDHVPDVLGRRLHSWNRFEVWGQPNSILVSRGGTQMKRWRGAMSDPQRAEAARLAREQG